ncbi:hypothetical protein [Streptomyces beijiangensis]|uniref:Lipoprotein n=1 Tax=Streptomyces beijiangensis TaxID=163361 RepID=A0A939FDS0_9ACTN|nr:hypothetical protein [Streptomyces beijiangensis]MBO0516778.1 hypothetical protein [Streptomyces beijiangensis]
MKKTAENRRLTRRRRKGTRAGSLILALALLGLTAACSHEPPAKELRAQATSPSTQSRRTLEEQTLRAQIEHLTAVKGLVHVLTRLQDYCARPYTGSIFESNSPRNSLECTIRASVYFGVQGDIADVLPRIRAANPATWGPQDDKGHDAPYAAGTVRYAVQYQHRHGKYPDGTLMPGPALDAGKLQIDWDRPNMPLQNRVQEPDPCPRLFPDEIYERCTIAPKIPLGVAAARNQYGTVLVFTASVDDYFTVPRHR